MNNNGKMNLLMGEDAVAMGMTKLSETEKTAVNKAYNDAIKKTEQTFKSNLNKELERSKQVKEAAKDLEIMPTNGYVLIRLYENNPYEVTKTTSSGLIIPTYQGKFQSKDSGEEETEDLAVRYAEVVEVGPEVKFVHQGDDIIFRNHTQLPAPFLGQQFWIVGQNNILVVINDNLKARLK